MIINSVFIFVGLKFDVGSATDSQEASALGYKNNYIMIYNNSWRPSDLGFFIDGPGSHTTTTLKNAVTSVRFLSLGISLTFYDTLACYYRTSLIIIIN